MAEPITILQLLTLAGYANVSVAFLLIIISDAAGPLAGRVLVKVGAAGAFATVVGSQQMLSLAEVSLSTYPIAVAAGLLSVGPAVILWVTLTAISRKVTQRFQGS